MSFIRYKKFGNKEYAYEVTAYWDSQKKKSRQKSKYLGIVVDKEKGIYKKKEVKNDIERLILDFGDVYILHEFMKNIKLHNVLHEVFSTRVEYLLLIYYRLCYPSAMKYARTWYQGNIAQLLFKDIDLSSQRISDFLEAISDESLQRNFFKNYISSFIQSKEGVIIDTTALPNQIHFPFNAWGYSDGEIEKQIRFLFVIDKDSSLPLYFRYLPGNIVDVSSLNTTVEELKMFGIKSSFILIDAGFFSEDNIKELYTENIDFLTRLPSSRKLYKNLVKEEVSNIESVKNAVRYGKRGLFIKQKKIELFEKKAYAHIVLDPERKGRETRKLLINILEEEEINEEHIEFKLMKCGIMILVSSFEIEKSNVVPFYYMRQLVEILFGFSKDDLDILPLRVHKEETLRGYLLLMFMTLIVFVLFRKAIGDSYTVEEVLLTMRNLKCKVYESKAIIQELTKQQKDIMKKLDLIVPKKMGV